MKNSDLDNLREKINLLDDEILNLLKKRADVVKKIGKHKDSINDIVDLNREQNILNRLIANSNIRYNKDTIVRIWWELFRASSNLQKTDNEFIQTKRSINSIEIYKGGKSNIIGKEKIIKLSSNENSFGPAPKVNKLLNTKNFFSNLHRYPEINGESLRKAISYHNKIDSEKIVLGCGSDEILLICALAFCQDGDEIIHAKHGFEMYPIISKVVGATSKIINEDINYKVSVNSICNQISVSTKLIFLANPNNPTGTYLNRSEIIELMMKIPKNIVVVLDGAYAEYVTKKDYDKGFSLVKKFENLIITRTFSKAYGLAGLRIGWCYSGEKVCRILNKVKSPFNTSFAAQRLAIEALKDKSHIRKVVKSNTEVKKWFEKELKKLNIIFHNSEGNFTFIKTTEKKAKKITKKLFSSGILIRQLISYNLPNCLRITIGTKNEMKATIDSLKELKINE